jgi:hypothetical protein
MVLCEIRFSSGVPLACFLYVYDRDFLLLLRPELTISLFVLNLIFYVRAKLIIALGFSF